MGNLEEGGWGNYGLSFLPHLHHHFTFKRHTVLSTNLSPQTVALQPPYYIKIKCGHSNTGVKFGDEVSELLNTVGHESM